MVKKSFKYCWITYNKIYLADDKKVIHTLLPKDLPGLLEDIDLKISKQRVNNKIEGKE